VLGGDDTVLCRMLGRDGNALLATCLHLLPPAHSTAQCEPNSPVALGQASKIAFPLIRHNLVAVVVDHAHFSLLVCS
jgi:hypothetical protein